MRPSRVRFFVKLSREHVSRAGLVKLYRVYVSSAAAAAAGYRRIRLKNATDTFRTPRFSHLTVLFDGLIYRKNARYPMRRCGFIYLFLNIPTAAVLPFCIIQPPPPPSRLTVH